MLGRKIDQVGRLTIPTEFRKALGLAIGEYANMELQGNKIVITNPNAYDVKSELLNKVSEIEGNEEAVNTLKNMIELL